MKYKNNPFNIRKGSKWLGLENIKNGFCEFSNLIYGIRACIYLLRKTYPRKYYSFTVQDCIRKFAPDTDGNDTEAYIDFVCSGSNYTRLHEVCSLSKVSFFYLLKRMALIESGTKLTDEQINDAIKLLKNE